MPIIARAEPPPDQFIIPTNIRRFAVWLKEHLRAMVSRSYESREYDIIILHELTEERTESGSWVLDVDASGMNFYVSPSGDEEQYESEGLPHYMSFLLIDLESDRTEVWMRYGPRAALHHYNVLKREIEDRWPNSLRQPSYPIEWPRTIKHARQTEEPRRYSNTQAIKKKQRPSGRPRIEVDEWARREIWLNEQPPDRVYTLWKKKIDPQRLKLMADPRDSFNKLMRKAPKEGEENSAYI